MSVTEADRIRALMGQARELMEEGRAPEAALVFGRVLLHDPACEDARRGLERARSASSEEDRRLAARLDQAERAIAAGDKDGARQVLEAVLDAGGDRDRAHALLDRLDERAGAVTLHTASTAPAAASGLGVPFSRREVSRRAFAFGWTLLLLTLATGLAFSWEALVSRLVAAPSPSARHLPPATRLPEPTAGERRIAEARRLLDASDPAGAIQALDGIALDDAAYPFGRQMRAQAEARQKAAGAR